MKNYLLLTFLFCIFIVSIYFSDYTKYYFLIPLIGTMVTYTLAKIIGFIFRTREYNH